MLTNLAPLITFLESLVFSTMLVMCVQFLGRRLAGVMLLSIEVAVEYWLALTWSPQAQWLNELAKNGIIQDEVCTLHIPHHSATRWHELVV